MDNLNYFFQTSCLGPLPQYKILIVKLISIIHYRRFQLSDSVHTRKSNQASLNMKSMWRTEEKLTVSPKGIEWYGGPKKIGMHPARKISLNLRVDAASPGKAGQNFADRILANISVNSWWPSGFSSLSVHLTSVCLFLPHSMKLNQYRINFPVFVEGGS